MPSPCPFLPSCGRALSWRDLNALRDDQGSELYRLCLEYGQQLWLEDLPARALLAVDRALYCDVPGDADVLSEYPMPYRAIGWMVKQPSENFAGNARVHYQHLADRVRGERADLKKWRAWAAWAVARHARPDLEGDPKHIVTEPMHAEIEIGLKACGLSDEIAEWRKALAD
ncbi:MAG: hypothetical protein ORN22_06055 [Opitutales bacterium]|nr:hypothetical protein [Opitutales bacterium]